MNITLNGQIKEFSTTLNLAHLVDQSCRNKNPVIAEVNGEIIQNPLWNQTLLNEGDAVELIGFVGGGSIDTPSANPASTQDTPFTMGGKTFTSRFMLGTGKFKNKTDLAESITASQTEIVTVALRRIDLKRHEDNILEYIPKGITLLTNTSGARNADEAVRIARLARESGHGNWIKIEAINDSKYLLPDNNETIKATEILAAEGFIVLPYMFPDLYAARALVKAGAAAVMPLGSLIGSNQGLKAKEFIKILIEEITEVPIIVDAGIGLPSQAAEAMELGADAVLANTAVATADNPVGLAEAFALAVKAGRLAYLANNLHVSVPRANASSPLTHFLHTP